MTRVAVRLWVLGVAHEALASAWDARWTIGACALAGGLAFALATALLLRAEGRR